jgi:hypothetical protein
MMIPSGCTGLSSVRNVGGFGPLFLCLQKMKLGNSLTRKNGEQHGNDTRGESKEESGRTS